MTADNYAAVVQQLYISYFGRPADYYGLASFEAQLSAAGAPTDLAGLNSMVQSGAEPVLNMLVDSFGNAAESIALYGASNGTGTISAFVNAIYTNVLNRDADSSGLAFWTQAIGSGVLSKADASVAITEAALENTSDQGRIDGAVVSNKLAVATSFTKDLITSAQINGYAGDAAAATARAMLSSVTGSTDPAAFEATIESTISEIAATATITTTLSISQDNLNGTSANDIYLAPTVISSTGASVDTLTSSDVIDGYGGDNILKATINAAFVDGPNGGDAPTLINIQSVQVLFGATPDVELNLINATGVTSIIVANSTGWGSVQNVGGATTFGISDQIGEVIFGSSTAKVLTLLLDTDGNISRTGMVYMWHDVATTINLNTDNSYSSIETDSSIRTLIVAANGINNINVNDSSAIDSVIISGTGSLSLPTALPVVTMFNAAGNSGGVVAELGPLVTSVVGSNGADTIVLDGVAAKANVDLGTGNDVLVLNGVVGSGDMIVGGSGHNTLVFGAFTDLSLLTTAAEFQAIFQDFQTLAVASANVDIPVTIDNSIVTGFSAYETDASAGPIAFTNLSSTFAVTINGYTPSLSLITDQNTFTDTSMIHDTLTLDNSSSTAGVVGVVVLSLYTDASTLTIHSEGQLPTTKVLMGMATTNVVTLDGAEANLSNVLIDGTQAALFVTGALAGHILHIDASAATGAMTIDASSALELVNINGGSAADTLCAGTIGGTLYGAGGGDTINLSATTSGFDTVVYKATSDSLFSLTAAGTLGAGIDTLIGFVAGIDKIDLSALRFDGTGIVAKTAADLNALSTLAATAGFYNDADGIARSAVEVIVGADSYLFVDANKDHKFDASTDLVIKLAGVTSISTADLIFA